MAVCHFFANCTSSLSYRRHVKRKNEVRYIKPHHGFSWQTRQDYHLQPSHTKEHAFIHILYTSLYIAHATFYQSSGISWDFLFIFRPLSQLEAIRQAFNEIAIIFWMQSWQFHEEPVWIWLYEGLFANSIIYMHVYSTIYSSIWMVAPGSASLHQMMHFHLFIIHRGSQ